MTTLDPMLLRRVVELLPRFAYRFSCEAVLHKGMAQVLTDAGIEFQHEFVAGPRDRFDFLLPGGIVIEAKVRGSMSEALTQLRRYAARDDVLAVVIVTTRYWGRAKLVDKLNGKPIRMVKLQGDAF